MYGCRIRQPSRTLVLARLPRSSPIRSPACSRHPRPKDAGRGRRGSLRTLCQIDRWYTIIATFLAIRPNVLRLMIRGPVTSRLLLSCGVQSRSRRRAAVAARVAHSPCSRARRTATCLLFAGCLWHPGSCRRAVDVWCQSRVAASQQNVANSHAIATVPVRLPRVPARCVQPRAGGAGSARGSARHGGVLAGLTSGR
jgi:hypothetical protein